VPSTAGPVSACSSSSLPEYVIGDMTSVQVVIGGSYKAVGSASSPPFTLDLASPALPAEIQTIIGVDHGSASLEATGFRGFAAEARRFARGHLARRGLRRISPRGRPRPPSAASWSALPHSPRLIDLHHASAISVG
jgi:hypothetical protein